MFFLGTHPFSIFLFFTIPTMGWILFKMAKDKPVLYLLCTCIVLLLPTLTGYSYIVENMDTILIWFGSSCLYFFILKYALFNLKPLMISGFFLAAGVGVFCISIFISGFTGTLTVEREWNFKDYKVQYLQDQGFAGGPLMKYELFKYGYLPIFIKYVDTKVDNDTTNNCIVKFEYNNFSFNKCK